MNKSSRLGYYLLPLFVLAVFFIMPNKVLAAPVTLYASFQEFGTGDCLSSENSCTLQTALDTAFTNNDDATINLGGVPHIQESSFTFDHDGFAHTLTFVGVGADITTVTVDEGAGLEIATSGDVSVSGMAFMNNTGAGLSIDSIGDVLVQNSIFSGNGDSGLRITHRTGDVTITGSTFEDNSTDTNGGGLYVRVTSGPSPVIISGNSFRLNTAGASGGGAYVHTTTASSPVTVNNNTFAGNTATANDGGGLYVYTTGSSSRIRVGDGGAGNGNTFTSNTSHGPGGGFYLDTDGSSSSVSLFNNIIGAQGSGNTSTSNAGGGGKVFAGSGLFMFDNEIVGNEAGTYAGGLAMVVDGPTNNSDHAITGNTFYQNTASTHSGGLDLYIDFAGNLTVNRNYFLGNTAEGGEAGGAKVFQNKAGARTIWSDNLIAENSSVDDAGGIWYYDVSTRGVDFINNTVAGNDAEVEGGGGLFAFVNAAAKYNFYNNIFWDNSSPLADDLNVYPILYSEINFNNNDFSEICFVGSGCNPSDGFIANYNHANNISVDPRFEDDSYELTELSSAVNAGDDDAPSLSGGDLLGNGRIQHTHVDMGAYELIIPEEHQDPYVLTELTQIPSSLSSGTTTATYYFSITGSGEVEMIATTCGHGSEINLTDFTVNPEAQEATLTNLAPGQTYTCTLHMHSVAGDSNTLTIGPFTVANSGAVPLQFLIDQVRATAHPDGSLVLHQGTVYLIKNGQRFGFRDPAEYQSYGYNFAQVVAANDSDLRLEFKPDNILKAMPGTLVIDKADGRTVYMIGVNYTKRGFIFAAVFNALGYGFRNLPLINLTDYPTGPVIDSGKAAHPDGSLVLDGKTVWWILSGTKQGFESQVVFDTYGFSMSRVVKGNSADLALPTVNLVPLRDGTLVLDSGNYYIISNGTKRQFASLNALTNWGYKKSNTVNTSLANYVSGQMIN